MKTIIIALLFQLSLCQICMSQSDALKVESRRNEDKTVSFDFRKQKPGTYFLALWFTDLENATSRGYHNEVRGMGGHLMTVKPTNTDEHINYSYKYWYIRGTLHPKFDPELPYIIPLSHKKHFKVRHMSNLDAEYFGAAQPKNWNSYQFNTEIGDTVYSARKGLVIAITKSHKYQTGIGVAYQSTVNRMIIEHDDGTLASYSGFHKDHIFVEEGDKIYPYTPLGTLAQYDERKAAQLRFAVYYLDKVTPGQSRPKLWKDKIQYYAYIRPKFLTPNGPCHLKAGEEYKPYITPEVWEQELSKRELKRWKKLQNEKKQ